MRIFEALSAAFLIYAALKSAKSDDGKIDEIEALTIISRYLPALLKALGVKVDPVDFEFVPVEE